MKIFKNVALAISLTLASTHLMAQEFRMLSSWDKNYPLNPVLLDPFIKAVETASKGRMKFTVSGPETVSPFEQLQPVGSGAFQFLFTSGAYHFGTTPILAVAEALHGDLAAFRASGILDVIDKHYQKFGLKLVAMPLSPEGAYHIILRQPVGPSGDLSGRKIRSTPTYLPVIKMLGGVGVVLPPSDIYTALEKGMVDGAAWPVLGVLNYRWNEVAKYALRPGMGINIQPILMNLVAWNKLSEADRQILLQEGRKSEDIYYKAARELWQEEEKGMIASGMSMTQMGEAQKAKLRSTWEDGLFELAAAKNPKDVEELRQFARSKGLAR
jgi:TRAP-type C4-dicarboxylate transport system substrate-binding protein